MKPVLGFSTGTISRVIPSLNERIKYFADLGCQALEIGYAKKERFFTEPLSELDLNLLKNFSYVSLHAPGSRLDYNNDEYAREVLGDIEKIHKKHRLDLVVFHPDSFSDYSVLSHYSFPIGIENMDDKKVSFQTAETIAPIFKQHPDFGFVLYMNHCLVNDRSLNLAKDLFTNFSGRLKEVHVSGFETLHEPLFQTKQIELVSTVPIGGYPIIIEGMMSALEDVKKEYGYILELVYGGP